MQAPTGVLRYRLKPLLLLHLAPRRFLVFVGAVTTNQETPDQTHRNQHQQKHYLRVATSPFVTMRLKIIRNLETMHD